jgi:hypothetical protein
MIDVLHPSHSEPNFDVNSMNRRIFTANLAQHQGPGASDAAEASHDKDDDSYAAEEEAWLASIREADEETIHMPRHGALVMDVSLRDSYKESRQDIA